MYYVATYLAYALLITSMRNLLTMVSGSLCIAASSTATFGSRTGSTVVLPLKTC